MPTIEYKCGNCDHLFNAVVFRGDKEIEPPCPKCKSPLTRSLPRSESLFKGISNFSPLAKDTHEPGDPCGRSAARFNLWDREG